jgi:hypothetical protein
MDNMEVDRMNKKIQVYKNGEYIYTTGAFKTCKEAIADCKSREKIRVASIPDYIVTIDKNDKITARFKR